MIVLKSVIFSRLQKQEGLLAVTVLHFHRVYRYSKKSHFSVISQQLKCTWLKLSFVSFAISCLIDVLIKKTLT